MFDDILNILKYIYFEDLVFGDWFVYIDCFWLVVL